MRVKGTAAFVALLASLVLTAAASAGGGFDQNGYNATARLFNGTGSSWCLYKGLSADCEGSYGNDRLVMKWNAAWDACNAAGGDDASACAGAMLDNEWNGKVPGGSGETEHYKIIWVGSEGESSQYWRDGGYSIWGNYEVILDQGQDASGHFWAAHATPAGYGA